MVASISSPILVPKQTDTSDIDQFWNKYYIEQMNKGDFEKENKNVETREHGKG